MLDALAVFLGVTVFLWVFAVVFWVPAHFIEPEWARDFWTFPLRFYRDLAHDAFGQQS